MPSNTLRRDGAITVLALCAILCWEWGGQDMAMAAWFGSAAGFPLRDNALFDALLHRWPHHLAWVILFALMAQIRWPLGFFKALPRKALVLGIVATVLAILWIQILKRYSPTSCPWDARYFGGPALQLPHWRALLSGLRDGGGGHCFPAGGASSGFAFVAAYPFLRPHAPRFACYWLAAALMAGFIIGIAQQMRGAHFMSHTLWTAWLCWACGMVIFYGQAAIVGCTQKKTASAEAVCSKLA
jgi:membrane-associated PAP2 superfamily phosphatase